MARGAVGPLIEHVVYCGPCQKLDTGACGRTVPRVPIYNDASRRRAVAHFTRKTPLTSRTWPS
jgi:hypothetical protein